MTTTANIDLAGRKCEPCSKGTPPIQGPRLDEYMSQIHGWELIDDKKLSKTYKFSGYLTGADFVHTVAEIANSEDHHPDICFTYGKVRIELSTHKIGALSENDFIMAAKIDAAHGERYS